MVQLPTPFCGPKTRSLTLDSAPATLSERLLQHEFRTSFRTQTSKRRDWAEAIAERLREYRRKWNKTPKGKAHSQRCQQSEKGKATHKRYQSSAKGKATRKKYAVSEKGKARTEKFKATEKYQALGAKLLPGGSYSVKAVQIITIPSREDILTGTRKPWNLSSSCWIDGIDGGCVVERHDLAVLEDDSSLPILKVS
jgi:hypothetical protein